MNSALGPLHVNLFAHADDHEIFADLQRPRVILARFRDILRVCAVCVYRQTGLRAAEYDSCFLG